MRAVIGKKETVAKMTQYTELDLQGQSVQFKPGQYFFITLNPEDTEHKDELTHHFSIVNSPSQEGILSFTTRLRLDESLFKRTVYDANSGDAVEIGAIEGDFVLPDEPGKPLMFIALGIGITPYVSMLRYLFEPGKNGAGFDITLIYSDNETESMPFLDELKKLDDDNYNLRLITSITRQPGWTGESRHVDAQFLKDYFKDYDKRTYYISGPPKAVDGVKASLRDAGISVENIKWDSFDGY